MTKRLNKVLRRFVPLVSTGLLFQANGCTIDSNALVTGLTTTIVNNLISSFVYGALGVGL